jgi:hypothetical protein
MKINFLLLHKQFLLPQWGMTSVMAQGIASIIYGVALCWAVTKAPRLENWAFVSLVYWISGTIVSRVVFWGIKWYVRSR